jgi:hypothetical protein
MYVRLRITSTLPLHGRHPGEEFSVEVGPDGQIADALWRKRLKDEQAYQTGAVAIVGSPTVTLIAPSPPTAPPPAPDLAPFLGAFDKLEAAVVAIRPDVERIAQRQDALDRNVGTSIASLTDRILRLEQVIQGAISE